jgi:hypothetical protein
MLRALLVGLLLTGLPRQPAIAQSPAPGLGARIQGAIGGAIVGAAAGAAVGYLLGSLGGAEPSCIAPSNSCHSHSYGKQGARVGLIVGIPIGAIIGWRRA